MRRAGMRLGPLGLALAVAVAAPACAAAGETITVTTLEDASDFGGAHQVSDLPGPDGRVSFREACRAANSTPGPQTIEFAIPMSEWWLYNDRAILKLENGVFLLTDDETTIDFTTQTTFTGDTNPAGWEVGIYGLEPGAWGVAAIIVDADHCVVRGLDRVMQRGYGVDVRGHHNRVASCTISGPLYAGVKVQGNVGDPATGNVIGGTEPGEGNILSGGNAGVRIDGPVDGTVVIGNTLVGSPYAGVQVRGAYCCPDYTPYNTRIGGPTESERNWIADNGSFGEEGFPQGDQVEVEWAVGTIVEGNYIGTTEDGSARYPGASGTVGVGVRESTDTVIRGNLISGIRKVGGDHYAGQLFGVGVSIFGPNTDVVMVSNRIGSDAAGEQPVPNLAGVSFGWFSGYPSGGRIGGPAKEDANLIAFNERAGIVISSGVQGVTILGNALRDNGLLAIDLLDATGASGPTMNDAGDADSGGNGLQNFPELVTAVSGAASTTVTGALDSWPNEAFTVQVFASAACDPSGFGEGEELVGEVVLTTDATGVEPFELALSPVPAGQVLTATATRTATGDTSEFSACIVVEAGSLPGDVDGSGTVDVADLLAVIGAWGPCPAPCPPGCPEDIDGNCDVGVSDLLVVLANWS